MQNFLKENIALVAGISLPLLLIAFFFLAGEASNAMVEDPKYDAIFASNYNESWPSMPYTFKVEDGKLSVHFKVKEGDGGPSTRQMPELYIYEHKSGVTRRIDIDYSKITDGKVVDADIDAINERALLADSTSPDGWNFDYYYRGGGGFFFDIFGGYNGHSGYALRKATRAIQLNPGTYMYEGKLIGWRGDDAG